MFSVLALLWFLPGFGALLILGLGWKNWRHADSLPALFSAISFEQWVALVILFLHPIFYALARHYRKNEMPREIPPEEPDEMEQAEGNERTK